MNTPDHFIPRHRSLATGITALGLSPMLYRRAASFGHLALVAVDSKQPVKWGSITEKNLVNAA